jgi:hypothetical protein
MNDPVISAGYPGRVEKMHFFNFNQIGLYQSSIHHKTKAEENEKLACSVAGHCNLPDTRRPGCRR